MPGMCPKCETMVTVVAESIRARDEATGRTCPAVQFVCSKCRIVLGVSLEPDWHAQTAQIRSAGPGSEGQR